MSPVQSYADVPALFLGYDVVRQCYGDGSSILGYAENGTAEFVK
jgi:hypothetical protein